jgi:hypothetical protein
MAVPSASAGSGHASIAKKKCKKKGKKASASKKKCKKKKKVVALPGPIVRGTITWDNGAEVDLHAYDASGNHSGWVNVPTPGVVNNIPNATHSPDANGTTTGKTESFTDNIFVQGGAANRDFTFIGCFFDQAQTGTFVGINRLGQATTLPINTGANTEIVFAVPGGPAPPATSPCL